MATTLTQTNPYENNTLAMLGAKPFPGMEKNQLKLERTLGQGLFPRVAAQIGFGNTLEPQRQQSLRDLLTTLSPGNRQATLDRFATSARANAADSARLQDIRARQLGLGGGVAGGDINQAQDQINAYWQQLYSPEAQAQVQQALYNAISSGQSANDIQALLALLTGGAQQQAAQSQNQGNDALGMGMGLVGQLAGGGAFNGLLNKLF